MSTFGIMIDRVTDELKRSDLTAEARLAIKSAIRFYETKKFYFNEARSTLDTVAGQEYYQLPTNFQAIDSLTLTTSNYTYPLIPRTFQWIEEHQTNDNFRGRPTEYAVYGQQLRVYPIPNEADRMEMAYQTRFDELSATADTNAWMTDGEELIRMRAKVDLLQNVIMGPDALSHADKYAMRELNVLNVLRNETSARRSTGRVRPTQF